MPRLPYADHATASPDVVEALDALPLQLNVFSMVAHAETVFRPWLRYGAALLTELQLDPLLRELAILEVARLSDSDYEWVQHEAITRALGGTSAQIQAISSEEHAELRDVERTVLAFVREVVEEVRASDATLAGVRGHLSSREVVELLLVVGQYMAVARLAATTGIEIDEPANLAIVDAATQDGARA